MNSEYFSPSNQISGVTRKSTKAKTPLGTETELRRAKAGYLYVWPRPETSEHKQLYQADFYENDRPYVLEKMERELDAWEANWTVRRELLETILGQSERRILDVGSSGGFLLQYFEKHGWTTAGIEPSRRASEFARDRFGLKIFCGGIEDYAGNASFDVVHSSKVLEHVLDPDLAVERMASWIRPGGLAFIELPNDFNELQTAAQEFLEKDPWWIVPRHHLNYFDYDSLSALLREHGIEEIERLSSFPMEMFLFMGKDYVGNPEVGAECHNLRMEFEQRLVEAGHADVLRRIYCAFAQAGIGRTCSILARKI